MYACPMAGAGQRRATVAVGAAALLASGLVASCFLYPNLGSLTGGNDAAIGTLPAAWCDSLSRRPFVCADFDGDAGLGQGGLAPNITSDIGTISLDDASFTSPLLSCAVNHSFRRVRSTASTFGSSAFRKSRRLRRRHTSPSTYDWESPMRRSPRGTRSLGSASTSRMSAATSS